jgi:hypothetical protein
LFPDPLHRHCLCFCRWTSRFFNHCWNSKLTQTSTLNNSAIPQPNSSSK